MMVLRRSVSYGFRPDRPGSASRTNAHEAKESDDDIAKAQKLGRVGPK